MRYHQYYIPGSGFLVLACTDLTQGLDLGTAGPNRFSWELAALVIITLNKHRIIITFHIFSSLSVDPRLLFSKVNTGSHSDNNIVTEIYKRTQALTMVLLKKYTIEHKHNNIIT